ncbi:MAG: hypothetical protein HY606_04260 [Planctomycetes bacterium]|nr:hypothetical protein [Planctomycetota bacterium]
MQTAKILVIFGIMLLIAGCVPSLHPLFTEKDLVFEPALLGTWGEEGSKETWTFQKSVDNTYDLIITEKRTILGSEVIANKFNAYLVKLDKLLFLDIYPKEPEIEGDFYKFHLIPAHTFSKVWIEDDVLHLGMLDHDWLKKMIDNKKVNISYERLGDEPSPMIVLTASTKALQEFVLKYAEDAEAFPMGEVHRQKDRQETHLDAETHRGNALLETVLVQLAELEGVILVTDMSVFRLLENLKPALIREIKTSAEIIDILKKHDISIQPSSHNEKIWCVFDKTKKIENENREIACIEKIHKDVPIEDGNNRCTIRLINVDIGVLCKTVAEVTHEQIMVDDGLHCLINVIAGRGLVAREVIDVFESSLRLCGLDIQQTNAGEYKVQKYTAKPPVFVK